MAVICPKCGRQFDVTLFQFDRTITCDCGYELNLANANTIRSASDRGERADEEKIQLIPPEDAVDRRGDPHWSRKTGNGR